MKRRILIIITYLIIMTMMMNPLSADSGGYLLPQQAAYDVTFYDLDLEIDPQTETIAGSLFMQAEIVDPIDSLLIHLDNRLTVDSVTLGDETHHTLRVDFLHSEGMIYVDIPWEVAAGNFIKATIFYHGSPKVSSHPPWDDGFVWEKTPSGDYWVGVACETGGGDIWWPCKDHPSDEPDSMAIHITVPIGYTGVSNGRFIGSRQEGQDKMIYDWFVSTPINNYNVTFYIADFMEIEGAYSSVSGQIIPFYFWVLPEAYEIAQSHLPVFYDEFHFLETICGPFPFASDKHGWAHSPYPGMEHQTIIAYGLYYGRIFQVNDWGLDYIHFHELAHEWWGNLVTAKDWSDLWIHEGLGTYMEALYVEHISDRETYHAYMDARRPGNFHEYPLAPMTPMTAGEAFGYLDSYHRGAWVMHTLRFHLGDDLFFNLLKYWAYPDTSDTDNTGGRLCRLATTIEMKDLAEQVTNLDLDPFFDVFLREASYPYLEIVYAFKEATFKWITENDVALDLNVPILLNGLPQIVEMIGGEGNIRLPLEYEIVVDPDQWILMDEPLFVSSVDPSESQILSKFKLYQNYPNPFNPTTKINYELPITNYVNLSIFNLLGEIVTTLVDEKQNAGYHQVEWDASGFPSGMYYYVLNAGEYRDVKKMVLIR